MALAATSGGDRAFPPVMELHHETLEEEATHVTDEARMVLPGVQAVLGFQLVAVFNQRFESFSETEQLMHLAAFLLMALAMGLIMLPAAWHRQVERGCVTRRFINLSSTVLTIAMVPLVVGVAIDTFLIARLITRHVTLSAGVGLGTAVVLTALWFGLPAIGRHLKR